MKVLQLSVFVAGLICAMSVFAHTERYYNHPGQQGRYSYPDPVDRRQQNQQWRIERGLDDGRLTVWEARKLNRQQRRIARLENRLESDGWLTPDEQWLLQRELDNASRHINRLKHNDNYRASRYGNYGYYRGWH